MNIRRTVDRLAWILLSVSILVTPVAAQTRPAAPARTASKAVARETPPTFDTLLAADSFRIYGEIRGAGQVIRSSAVNDLLDPLMKLSSPPKEIKTMVTWLNAHADQLITSRVLFAGWPTRAKLPQFICAIEFASPEEARKFEPQLRQFLPKVVPSPAPTPAGSPSPASQQSQPASEPAKSAQPPTPPYLIKQAGTLVLISESAFTFKNLRPEGSKLLAEDPEFRQLRDRFASEQAFLYFDVNSIIKQQEEQRRQAQERYEELQKGLETHEAAIQQQKAAQEAESKDRPEKPEEPEPDVPEPQPEPAAAANVQFGTLGPQPSPSAAPPPPSAASMAWFSLIDGFFGAPTTWPEAIGLALAFDNDSLNVRVLLLNPPFAKGNPIPFIPQLISGPPITPSASTILPADTEMFVTASLDYPAIHDGMLKAFAERVAARQSERLEALQKNPREAVSLDVNTPQSPFATYEKLLGIKIKDELLPLLGNEIAISLPLTEMFKSAAAPTPSSTTKDESSTTKPEGKRTPAPVIAIAIKDREAVKALIPKMINSMGMKGASLLAQTEKRDDTELVTYADMLAYAFVGDFLVGSTDVAMTRHVVDSYLKHETLGSESRFRNATRWQPRQVLGQVYVAQGLTETVGGMPFGMTEVSDKLRDVLSRLSPYNEPLTYALYNEGLGPLHELHLPKNVLMMLAIGLAIGNEAMPQEMNESMAQSALRAIVSAEETYKASQGKGSFGTLDQLVSANLISKDMLERGYRIEARFSGTKLEVSAVPLEYGKTGKRSFFIDESGVLRGADLGGGPATLSDKPVQ